MRPIRGINEAAPVMCASEIEISSPPETVWDVLAAMGFGI
jgi:hypothetical protein